MLTGTAQRTMRLRTLNVGLEMDYPCICGRRFASERGMKIHRTKMGCLNKSFQQQRTALADKTSENQIRAQNHSAKEIQAEDQEKYDSSSTLSVKRSISQQQLQWSSGKIWTAK
ncbi:reverse transcriptase [Elysia marginata]|uniref:Reverse transcriptase n=1 Tax=Elysia marginata TaxID=1093978 RepID=A0AAV4HCH9_9GAST|nr:reverse transcriptase [Elysia marginata]